jgi:hypothetical protein
MSGYNINPIENYSPLRHSNLVAEAIGEVIPEMLSSLRQLTNPYRVDLLTVSVPTTYEIVVELEEVDTSTIVIHTLTCTTTGTENLDEVYTLIVTEFIEQGIPVHCTYELDYTEDSEKYLTVVPKEGYRLVSPPVPTNLTLDTSTQVQAANGKPASFGAGQKIFEQDYPKIIVTMLPITSVSENWRSGAVQKDLGDGNGLQYFPYNDAYIRSNFSVTCEAGLISDILTSDRPDSSQILREFIMRMQDDNIRLQFYNKVQGTVSRDFTTTSIPELSYTEFENSSVMTFSLDLITRSVNYQGSIITKTTVVGATVEDKEGNQVNPVDFEVQSPNHLDP